MSYQTLEQGAALAGAVIVSSAGWDGGSAGIVSLFSLIDEAKGVFERDKARAQECLERALNLLKGSSPPADQSVGGLAKWQISRVSAYIEDHIGDQIRVTELAAAARLSPGHFSRRFKISFGEKPLAYVARKRVEHAQNLMLNSDSPLAILALDAGFCDQAHFTRVFKRTTGASPRAWLRVHAPGPQELAA